MNKRTIISVVATLVMLFGFNTVATAQESEWTYLSAATRGPQVGMLVHSPDRVIVATCTQEGMQLQLGNLVDASTTNQKSLNKAVLNQTKNKGEVRVVVKRPDGSETPMKFMKSRSVKLNCR